MTKEKKEAVLHCLRAMIDEELCEECPLYGTTGTDHCEKDCVRLAIEELEQEPKTDWIVPIILIDKKGEEHDGLMDMRRMLIYLHNIPAETAMSLGYTWKSTEGSDKS